MHQKLLIALPFILLFLIVFPAIWPIVTPGYFAMHDDTQLVRVQQMAQSLSAGQFPVRWVKDLGYGYGYPIFNFYNPLPYYLGAIPVLLGFDALVGTKFIFALPIILAALGMHILTRKRLGTPAALLAATLYTYAPYHAVQIYVRGATAEYWAYGIIPWLLYFLLERNLLGSAIFLAALILSHNLTTIMIMPFLGIFSITQILFTKNKLSAIGYWLLAIGLALGLSAFFWLPATLEKSLTNVDIMVEQQFNPLEHFVYPRQLLYSPWGFGGSSPTEHDGLSYMIGSIHIVLLLTSMGLWMKHRRPTDLLLASACLFLISLFMLLPQSRTMWLLGFRLLKYIQFPWRYLSLALTGISIMGGMNLALVNLKKDMHQLLTGVLICLTILINLQYFQPQFKYAETVNQLLTEEKIKWEYSGRSDEYLPKGFVRPESAEAALKIKNPHNQELVDHLLAPTPLRTTSNIISLISLIAIISLGVLRKPPPRWNSFVPRDLHL